MLCERAGVEHEGGDPLWRALGVPDSEPDERAFTEEDVRALRVTTQGLEQLTGAERERALEFLEREVRTLSGYLAGIAEMLVDAFAEMDELGLREQARAEARARG